MRPGGDLKTAVLEILSKDRDVVSGERLSRRLGVSRVAVWKHIQKLRELGYPIDSFGNGYRLSEPVDGLFPWELPRWNLHYFPETDSTMNEARKLAREGAPHFTVVAAERQSRGRGRLERQWTSERGGLYGTLILRPPLPPSQGHLVLFAVSVALAETLIADPGVPARVKWPNDILVDERKVCGILSEMEADTDRIRFLNVGFGVNVNNSLPEELPQAVSLRMLLGRPCSRKALLDGFLQRLERQLAEKDIEGIVPRWKALTATLGRTVRIVTTGEVVEGEALDLDETGALILRGFDGTIHKVRAGDCFHNL